MSTTKRNRWVPLAAAAALTMIILSTPGGPTAAQDCEVAKLVPSPTGPSPRRFGSSVSVDGDVLLAGAPASASGGCYPGEARVFRWDGVAWVLEQVLIPFDGTPGDGFGGSLALSGNVAVVGAPYDGDLGSSSGSAYVYRFDGTTWVEEQKLTDSDGAENDYFGTSVAVCDGVALVGARGDDDLGSSSGSAYVYRFDGTSWVEEQKVTASDGAVQDWFGSSVSLSGDVALVSGGGRAYVFQCNGVTWFEEAALITSDGVPTGPVSLDGDLAVLGAPLAAGPGGCTDPDYPCWVGAAYVYRHDGTTWMEEQKLTASDGAEYDRFGTSVAVDDDLVVVGAIQYCVALSQCVNEEPGAAYVYRYDGTTWMEEQKLTDSDGAEYDRFGISVAVDDDLVVVGATQVLCIIAGGCEPTGPGAAYVYRDPGSGNWVEEEKLAPSDGAEWDHFGTSVSLSGDVAVVGASQCDYEFGTCTGPGTAVVYRHDGTSWVREQELTPTDGDGYDNFGSSVSLSGEVLVVGAGGDDDLGGSSGAAYVYRFDGTTWIEEQKLNASDGATNDYFGGSVAVSGDVAVVGAFDDDDLGHNSGSAYVYRFDGTSWVEEQKLTASDGAEWDRFGGSVALSGNVALVSGGGKAYAFQWNGLSWQEEAILVPSDAGQINVVSLDGAVAVLGAHNGFEETVGVAYVYRHDGTTWVEEQQLTASDGAEGDWFGYSVAVSGDVVLAGAFRADGAAPVSGATYVYRYDAISGTWGEEEKLTASDGTPGDWFGYSVAVSGDVVFVGATKDDDGCFPFECSFCYAGAAYVFDLAVCVTLPHFIRGDSDGNGIFNALADGLYLLTFGFLGGPPPPCLEAAEADGDGAQNALADGLYILTHGFLGGPPPGPPYPSCGIDPDPMNSLGCDVSTCP